MGPVTKWIGGGTLGVLLVLGSAVVSDQALEAMNPPAAARTTAAAAPGRPATLLAASKAEPRAPVAARPKPAEPFVIKRILPIDGPIKYGQWFWDDKGVPDEEERVRRAHAVVDSLRAQGLEVGAPTAEREEPDPRLTDFDRLRQPARQARQAAVAERTQSELG